MVAKVLTLYHAGGIHYNSRMERRIGFIGLGVMGHSMAMHLLKAGNTLYVYNRTRSKASELEAAGAIWSDTPAAVAASAEVLFTIVGYPADVEAVYLGKDGILEGGRDGLICCDMTTTKPSLEVKISNELAAKGISFADAPVSGGDKGAREAALTIMVGADEKTYLALYPFFELMGKKITRCGEIGAGQQTKMCNQIVIAGTMIGVSEALVYGAAAGLDLETMVNTIRPGAAGCWTLDNLAPRVLKGDFAPGFMIEHFVKDMGIALEESANMGLALPGLALVNQLYTAMKGQELGKCGTQALVKAIQQVAGKNYF